jgi:photosystem II stability/assembly factor-like uncharacterized protein
MSHHRIGWLCRFIMVFMVATATAFAANDPSIEDAGLNDVFFLDAQCGWAVGDQGVIWHTEDGGRAWRLQPSGTVCSLRSVHFIDRRTGWAVGGQGLPYSAGSRGLVLATVDGGQSWQPLSWDQFPRLTRVQFQTANDGWACGEASQYYPSGLLSTDSGGRRWAPGSGGVGTSWLAAFFTRSESGVLAGSSGTTALLINRKVTPVSVGSLGGRAVRSLKFSNDGTCWAVADGAVVLRSTSRGSSWTALTSGMPEEAGAIFDWRGVHAIARSVWIVGRPGSVVLHSGDAGNSWQTIGTGQCLPLESVWFHDRQHGWAVGALGTILATQDGGFTWEAQRRGGERAAVLSVHGLARTSPLLAHVQLGAERGYLTADLAMVCPPDTETHEKVNGSMRLGDAVRVAGGAAAESDWRFPSNSSARSLSQVLDDWNRQHEGHGLKDLERRLVIALRTWRPDVVLAESPDPTAADAGAALVSQALERAFRSAADETAFPELIESAQLIAWRPTKLFTATHESTGADAHIDSSELSTRPDWAGRPLDDQVSMATSLLAESYRSTEPKQSFRLVASHLTRAKGDDSLMAGIVLEPGGPARRRLLPPAEISDAQRKAVQSRRNLLAILARAESQPLLAQQMNAQVAGLLRDLPADQAGNVLYSLARTHFSHGRWRETAELLEKVLNEHPAHLAAAEAQRWLVQFYASSEARHRESVAGFAGQSVINPQPVLPPQSPDAKSIQNEAADSATPSAVRMALDRQSRAVGGVASGIPWAQGSVDTAKRLMHTAPLVWSEPQVQFALAAAHRTIGNVKDADKFYTTFALGREAGAWSDAARSERWIRDRKGMPAKPVATSQRSPTPPRLDGVLDDPIWKTGTAITLSSIEQRTADGWSTELRVAHDERFLYVAFSCDEQGAEASEPVRPRSRDMDLSAHDRVELYLDLDRDYGTYYRLAIDRRGCVYDDCWGDRTWDPTWYVASRGDDRGYKIEAAIPLVELTDTPPADGTVWCLNAIRIVPGNGLRAWSPPADSTPRLDGMGLLVFSDGRPSPPPRPAIAN